MKLPKLITLLETQWDQISPKLLQYDLSRKDITEKIREFYKLGQGPFNYFQEFPKLTQILSDRMYLAATHELAKIQSHFSSVYMYYYNYHGDWQFVSSFVDGNYSIEELESMEKAKAEAPWWIENIIEKKPPNFGVSHADELSLFFNYTGSIPITKDSKDFEMSEALVNLWVQYSYDE